MTNRITIRCSVCGCETTINNAQPGRKIFCLHCGRKITDSYQPGMENQLNMECQQSVNFRQEPELNPPPQPNSVPEENVVPPPPPIDNLPINNFNEQREGCSELLQPDWKTEPYIRINWKRIEFTLSSIVNSIASFVSNCVAKIGKRFHSDPTLINESPAQFEEPLNDSPVSDVTPPPAAPEPELPFGYVDRRQQRMQQSFSRTFADSNAIPVPPSNPNYSQQRIDNSFSNSFADSGAIPVPPSNPNYSQQRIDNSFSNSFAESGAIPASPSNSNYSRQRIDQSFTKSFQDNENKQS